MGLTVEITRGDLPPSFFATWLQLNLSMLGDFQVLVNFVSWFQFVCLIQLHGHT